MRVRIAASVISIWLGTLSACGLPIPWATGAQGPVQPDLLRLDDTVLAASHQGVPDVGLSRRSESSQSFEVQLSARGADKLFMKLGEGTGAANGLDFASMKGVEKSEPLKTLTLGSGSGQFSSKPENKGMHDKLRYEANKDEINQYHNREQVTVVVAPAPKRLKLPESLRVFKPGYSDRRSAFGAKQYRYRKEPMKEAKIATSDVPLKVHWNVKKPRTSRARHESSAPSDEAHPEANPESVGENFVEYTALQWGDKKLRSQVAKSGSPNPRPTLLLEHATHPSSSRAKSRATQLATDGSGGSTVRYDRSPSPVPLSPMLADSPPSMLDF